MRARGSGVLGFWDHGGSRVVESRGRSIPPKHRNYKAYEDKKQQDQETRDEMMAGCSEQMLLALERLSVSEKGGSARSFRAHWPLPVETRMSIEPRLWKPAPAGSNHPWICRACDKQGSPPNPGIRG